MNGNEQRAPGSARTRSRKGSVALAIALLAGGSSTTAASTSSSWAPTAAARPG